MESQAYTCNRCLWPSGNPSDPGRPCTNLDFYQILFNCVTGCWCKNTITLHVFLGHYGLLGPYGDSGATGPKGRARRVIGAPGNLGLKGLLCVLLILFLVLESLI